MATMLSTNLFSSPKITIIAFLLLAFTGISNSQTWKSLGLAGENITAIAVDSSSGSQVIYAGSYGDYSSGTLGGVFKTTDGGATWDTLGPGMNVIRIVINPQDPDIVYAALAINYLNGITGIMKTVDGGHTWASADSGIYFPPDLGVADLTIDPEHPDTLYAATYGITGGGRVYKSVNGGIYWSKADTMAPWFSVPTLGIDSMKIDPLADGATAISIDPWNNERVYAGSVGVLYLVRTSDGGRSWSYAGLTDTLALASSIAFGQNSNEIFVSTSSGTNCNVYFSSNSGSTWKSVLSDGYMGSIQIQRIYNVADTVVRVFVTEGVNGMLGTVYESTDKGGTWLNTGGTGNGTLCLFGNKLYTGGNGISVADSLLTGVNKTDASRVLPSTFSLSQNYPNPFNPSTTIQYQLPHSEKVLLRVYDILGRALETLVNEEQTAGVHTVQFNGNGLASGVYFYEMGAGAYGVVRKMLLEK